MIKIRFVKKDDYKKLKSLFNNNSIKIMSKINWLNMWRNPYLKQKGKLGYVLVIKKKIVAHIGFYPCKYFLKKIKYNSLVLHSLVVEKKYRSVSILLIKKFFFSQKADFIISTTTSELAGKILKAFGMKKLSIKSLDESRIIILNYFKFSKFILKSNQYFLKKIIFLSTFYLLYLVKKLFKKNRLSSAKKINLFDNKYNKFWDTYLNNSNNFNLDRNKNYQNWFLRKKIISKEAWVFVIKKNDEIVGYSSTVIKKKNNFKIALLTDLVALNEDENILKDLVAANIKELEKKNCIYFELANSSFKKYKIFQLFNSLSIKWKKNGFYYKSNNSNLNKLLKKNFYWSTTSLDGDIAV